MKVSPIAEATAAEQCDQIKKKGKKTLQKRFSR